MNNDLERKQSEIEQGRKIAGRAAQVWQRDTPAGRRRVESRFEHFRAWFDGQKRVLELGCGTGEWTTLISSLPFELTSTDLSPDLLAIARKRLPAVTFVEADIEALPFPEQSFDGICGLSVLHHLDIKKTLSEIYRLLKPGGKIWFSEPNMLNPQIMLQKNIPIIKRWSGDTPDETAFFRWPFERLLKSYGFVNTRVVPFDFLHPQIPAFSIPLLERLGLALERTPGLREIGGSLRITATKA